MLDGIRERSDLAEFVHETEVTNFQILSAIPTLRYDDSSEKLYLDIPFVTDKEPTKQGIEEIRTFCTAMVQGGWGSNYEFDYPEEFPEDFAAVFDSSTEVAGKNKPPIDLPELMLRRAQLGNWIGLIACSFIALAIALVYWFLRPSPTDIPLPSSFPGRAWLFLGLSTLSAIFFATRVAKGRHVLALSPKGFSAPPTIANIPWPDIQEIQHRSEDAMLIVLRNQPPLEIDVGDIEPSVGYVVDTTLEYWYHYK